LIHYKEISADDIPLDLLLIADPSQANIAEYLQDAVCFGAYLKNELVCACVLNLNTDGDFELFNIASLAAMQGQGIGTRLLEFVIGELKDRNIERLVLGTGTFGYQLTFYQRLGFRVDAVIQNFFINNYEQAVYENGIQHIDMLRLTLQFDKQKL